MRAEKRFGRQVDRMTEQDLATAQIEIDRNLGATQLSSPLAEAPLSRERLKRAFHQQGQKQIEVMANEIVKAGGRTQYRKKLKEELRRFQNEDVRSAKKPKVLNRKIASLKSVLISIGMALIFFGAFILMMPVIAAPGGGMVFLVVLIFLSSVGERRAGN